MLPKLTLNVLHDGRRNYVLENLLDLNSPFPNYAPLLTNKTFKSRLGALFSYICCIFEHLASTQCFCLSELERNSEMGY